MAGANFGLSIVESECVPGSLPLKLRSFRVDSGHGKNYIKTWWFKILGDFK